MPMAITKTERAITRSLRHALPRIIRAIRTALRDSGGVRVAPMQWRIRHGIHRA